MQTANTFIKKLLKTNNELVPISKWSNCNKEITVSIHCFVYNQEKYITRCLDSFLKQLVNFNVEIIVHDDCSIDNSKTIIDSYCKKYPNIIKPIYEETNLYSRTGNFLEIAEIMNKQSNGKYIAICEADDYWIDPMKLFLQTSILDNYFNCSFCVNRVKVLSDESDYQLIDNQMPSFRLKTKLLDDKSFISLVNTRYSFQTSSYFFRKKDYDALLDNKPLFMRLMPTDDEVLLRYFGSLGKTCFIDRVMSVYLQFSLGSWSKNHKTNKDNSKKDSFLRAIDEFDKFTKLKYHRSCEELSLKTKVFLLMESKQYKSILKNKLLSRALFKIDFKTFLSLKIKYYFGLLN